MLIFNSPLSTCLLYVLITIVTIFILNKVITSNNAKPSYASSNYNNKQSKINVAFVGNSIQYFQDLPRFIEVLSSYTIYQNSCLRPTATLTSILKKGNGMKTIFNTSKALLDDGVTYDIGSSDVYSLLLGGGSYINNYNNNNWDYVVLNDRTYYPAKNSTRAKTIQTLKTSYAPIFQSIGAIPIFISTHAYRAPSNQTKNLGDIYTYTSLVSQGVEEYAQVLSAFLPNNQSARVAHVGKAFQIIYKENYTLWYNLFNIDNYHPSPHGTYLQGCIVYCTIFDNELPDENIALPNNPASLFDYSRVMQPIGWTSGGDYLPKPTLEEAQYLYSVAGRVCCGEE